jgi:hypothetical protein
LTKERLIASAIVADQALVLERLERPLPASWKEQREHLCS